MCDVDTHTHWKDHTHIKQQPASHMATSEKELSRESGSVRSTAQTVMLLLGSTELNFNVCTTRTEVTDKEAVAKTQRQRHCRHCTGLGEIGLRKRQREHQQSADKATRDKQDKQA